ncbi:MAG TPA: hypothetical protein VFP98_08815, partial [Candidatus Polarisedimenticolia bacterium]|nr:hypothetical protein [Candidatus Polarisedimenticolia bacterium]
PAIVALRRKLHTVADEEMRRYRPRLGPLSEKQEEAIREMLTSVVNKMVHGPTREMKRGGPSQSGAVDMVRRMFNLAQDDGEDAGGEGRGGG